MRLIIVRHGETEENVSGITQGHIHGHLSKAGIAQVKKLAKELSGEKIDAVFSSDLGRCIDTTHAILRFHSSPVHYTRALRERSYGVYEGGPHTKFREDAMAASDTPYHKLKPKGGESYVDVKRRVSRLTSRLPKRYSDKSVLLVTHGGVVRCLVSIYLEIPLIRASQIPTPKNAGMLVLDVSGVRTRVVKNTLVNLPRST